MKTLTWHTLDNYEYYIGKWKGQFTIGPSGVRALPLDAGTREGGHYFGPSGVRALPVVAGTNEGGHYF